MKMQLCSHVRADEIFDNEMRPSKRSGYGSAISSTVIVAIAAFVAILLFVLVFVYVCALNQYKSYMIKHNQYSRAH